MGGGHSEIEDQETSIVPAENLLGGEGQRVLPWASIDSPTDDCATACTMSPWPSAPLTWPSNMSPTAQTFGKKLEERQGVQFMLADCASQLYIARLMLMHIAYKAENGLDLRNENGIAKVYLANMVHKVVDTAIQLHGALGYSLDTPLAALVHPHPLPASR
jgi:acyl-CoA dehydrogenase